MMGNKDDIKKLKDEKKTSEATKGEIQTTRSQREFLKRQIPLFNQKVADLLKAHAEATELGTMIRDFSTSIVAGEKDHDGLWFAAGPDLVVRRGTAAAKQLPSVCWPQPEEEESK